MFFFQDLNFGYSRSLKCPLHIAFYALRIGVFVSHTFQHKHCIFIAGAGNLIIYVLSPFSRKWSHILKDLDLALNLSRAF